MINSTILKAAVAAVGQLAQDDDPRQRLVEMGIGESALNTMLERTLNDYPEDHEAMALQAFFTGLFAERFDNQFSVENPKAAALITELANSYALTEEDGARDIVNDAIDILMGHYETEVPDRATGTEVISLLQQKVSEDPEADDAAVDRLAALIGATD